MSTQTRAHDSTAARVPLAGEGSGGRHGWLRRLASRVFRTPRLTLAQRFLIANLILLVGGGVAIAAG